MWLEQIEWRTCEILLSAARRRASVAEFRADLQAERIYSKTWLPIFKALGLVCEPISPDSEQRFLTFKGDNVVAFAPLPAAPSRRQAGAAR
jgi:hypothetical protein